MEVDEAQAGTSTLSTGTEALAKAREEVQQSQIKSVCKVIKKPISRRVSKFNPRIIISTNAKGQICEVTTARFCNSRNQPKGSLSSWIKRVKPKDTAQPGSSQDSGNSSINSTKEKKYGKCWNCLKKNPDHQRKNCPNPKKKDVKNITCLICAEKGHKAISCKLNPLFIDEC